jgi:hypothetical protein
MSATDAPRASRATPGTVQNGARAEQGVPLGGDGGPRHEPVVRRHESRVPAGGRGAPRRCDADVRGPPGGPVGPRDDDPVCRSGHGPPESHPPAMASRDGRRRQYRRRSGQRGVPRHRGSTVSDRATRRRRDRGRGPVEFAAARGRRISSRGPRPGARGPCGVWRSLRALSVRRWRPRVPLGIIEIGLGTTSS